MTPIKSTLFVTTLIGLLCVPAIAGPPDPCPGCPAGGTNQSYIQSDPLPSGALAIRIASITAETNNVLILTNYGFVTVSNGFYAGNHVWLSNMFWATQWRFLLSATNTKQSSDYVIQSSGNAQSGYLPSTYKRQGAGIGSGESAFTLTVTNPQSANAFFRVHDATVVVNCNPGPVSGTQCGLTYIGRGSVSKTSEDGWGWEVDTNAASVTTCYDGSGRTDTIVSYLSFAGASGCGTNGSVVVPAIPGTKYRFAVYFRTNLPSTNYPLRLVGFKP